jgi:hypothetical protein
MVCCWARGAVGETESQQVLRGERVAVEVAVKDGRLRERYLAVRNGAWVEVASSDPAQTLGPVSVISGGKLLDGSVEGISLRDGALSTPFAWKRQPVVVFRRAEPTRRYRLVVNGSEAGTWRGDDLEKGVTVSFGRDQ